MGISPGKALLGLRVVHLGSGTPIGMGPALLRTLIVGASALPTFGLGLAALAWTAVMDPGRQRRGWHDNVTSSIVVDVRPVPVEEEEVDHGPRHVVNLTAMRLVPAQQPAPVAAPARPPRPTPTPTAAVPEQLAPEPPAPEQPAPQPPAPNGGWPGVLAPTPRPTTPPDEAPAERTRPRAQDAAPPRWRVTFDDGTTFVVEGLALVGRRPEPRQGEPVQHLVPLHVRATCRSRRRTPSSRSRPAVSSSSWTAGRPTARSSSARACPASSPLAGPPRCSRATWSGSATGR